MVGETITKPSSTRPDPIAASKLVAIATQKRIDAIRAERESKLEE